MSFRKTFLKLTLQLELFTHTVPLPFAIYMGSVASGLNRENQMIMLMTCFSWAGATVVFGIVWRYWYLQRIFFNFRRIESSDSPETAECLDLKLRLMKYPFREAAVIVFRWVAGSTPAVFHTAYIIGFQNGYLVIQMLPIVILMVTPLSYMAYFFLTENTVSELMKKDYLVHQEIPPDRLPKFNSYARIILTVFGLTAMPFTLFGYLLYSLDKGYFTVGNPAAHVLFLAVMFSFPMMFVAYILGTSVRNGIASVNETLQKVSDGNFSVKLPVSAMDDFSVQAYHLNQVIGRLSSMYTEIRDLNTNLENKVQERTQSLEEAKAEMESLNELTRNINSVSSLIDIMSFVMYYLETDFGYKDFWLILMDRNKTRFETFSFVSSSLPSETSAFFKSWNLPVNPKAGKIYEVYSAQEPAFCAAGENHSMSPFDLDILRKTAWKYLYYIPLIIYGETIGILSVNKPVPPDSISEEEKDRLQKISDQIAGAVQNAELLKEAEEARKQVEFLNEFSKVINSAKDLDTVFKNAVKELAEKLGTDIYILQLVDRNKKELFTRCRAVSVPNSVEFLDSLRIPLHPDSGTVYRTFITKKTFYFRNNDKIPDSKLSGYDIRWKQNLNVKSTFQVPLLVQGEVIGIMHINNYGIQAVLDREEIRFAELLCEQLAIAVNNSFLYEQTEKEREKSEKLLLNILPEDVAEELKEKGATEPVLYDSVSVLFTDFKGFTKIAENMSPQELIKELDGCFSQFDRITERFGLEKLKTIGDSYMCAGGIPKKKNSSVPGAKSAVDAVLAALEIQAFMNQMKEIKMMLGVPYWELRLGIHSGPLVAGVIGEKKFAYDVWGDTVNTASRMESSGTPGKINISGSTYELVKDFFDCEYRGRVNAKNKGEVDMHYVLSIREGYRKTISSNVPNEEFWKKYEGI